MNLCYSVAHAGNRRSEENYSNFTGMERRSASLGRLPAPSSRTPACRRRAHSKTREASTHTHTRATHTRLYRLSCVACTRRTRWHATVTTTTATTRTGNGTRASPPTCSYSMLRVQQPIPRRYTFYEALIDRMDNCCHRDITLVTIFRRGFRAAGEDTA